MHLIWDGSNYVFLLLDSTIWYIVIMLSTKAQPVLRKNENAKYLVYSSPEDNLTLVSDCVMCGNSVEPLARKISKALLGRLAHNQPSKQIGDTRRRM